LTRVRVKGDGDNELLLGADLIVIKGVCKRAKILATNLFYNISALEKGERQS
jgi:hypothetical protein